MIYTYTVKVPQMFTQLQYLSKYTSFPPLLMIHACVLCIASPGHLDSLALTSWTTVDISFGRHCVVLDILSVCDPVSSMSLCRMNLTLLAR